MSKSKYLLISLLSVALVSGVYYFNSNVEEKHPNHEDHKEHGKHEEDGDHKEHDDHDEHEEHEENNKVGPDKGITSADEKNGFGLSKEAFSTFNLKILPLTGAGPWKISKEAFLYTQEEVNLYRIRNNLIKRIDFQIKNSGTDFYTVSSDDLAEGDGIIATNIGFVRMAELVAFGSAEEGHHH